MKNTEKNFHATIYCFHGDIYKSFATLKGAINFINRVVDSYSWDDISGAYVATPDGFVNVYPTRGE